MMRLYRVNDFIRVRNFLIETYAVMGRPYNWTIERWNFAVSLARIMNGVSREKWESRIAVWEQEGKIIAVVNTEGENRGEAFFQLAQPELPLELLNEMFEHCDDHLGKIEDGSRVIRPHIHVLNERLEAIARERGYVLTERSEPVAELVVDGVFPVELTQGFSVVAGDRMSAAEKGMAHARAFGYVDEPVYCERSPEGYAEMQLTPDYRADLDLYVLAPDGEIASFATVWYDERNMIGILEPVGTCPPYRKMGLGRACVYQAVNLVRSEGAERVFVGSNQQFYQRLGFRPSDHYRIWEKRVPISE